MDGDDICVVYDAMYKKDHSKTQARNVLIFLAVGKKHACELAKLPEKELVQAALIKIDKLFDGQGTRNYVKHIVQNWTQEPFVQGAYSFPCNKKHIHNIRKSIDSKILFAGEHTSLQYQQLVQGAVTEGRRAAVEAALGSRR